MNYETANARSYQGKALQWQSYNRAHQQRSHWAVVVVSRAGVAWTLEDRLTLEDARARVALESESGEIGPSERMEIRDTREVTP